MVLKALNKVTLNKGRKVIVEMAGENTGKSDKSGKKRSKENVKEEKSAKRKETKADKKRISRAVKSEAIQPHVVLRRKTTGNSSSRTTAAPCVVKSLILQKKAGPNEANAKSNIRY